MRQHDHSEVSEITDYASADAKLHNRGGNPVDSCKVGNNTYLKRRDENNIAVRLYATDVVTFNADGTVTLNTGGWFTVTTKDRMNKWLPPPFSIFSKRGTWHVSLEWGKREHVSTYESYIGWNDKVVPAGEHRWTTNVVTESVPYFDGMILNPTDGTVVNGEKIPDKKARDKRNAKMRKDIAAYVKLYTDERIAELLESARNGEHHGDCWFCLLSTEDGETLGDATGDHEHLIAHMRERYTMASTLVNAIKASGRRDPAFIMAYAPDLARRDLSRYLRKALLEATMVNH